MATASIRSLDVQARVRALARGRVLVPLGLLALVAASLATRTNHLGTGFWIDEGLSQGIADRPLTDIPGVMRRDGSPPLYYMLLHLWMRGLDVYGVRNLHLLSVVFALVAIPVAFAFARSLFGMRSGWIAAVLVAVNPFLTQYAQEARMYSLVVLLSITAVGAFLGAFAFGRGRGWAIGFALAQVALLYTHNWGLFLGVGLAASWLALVLIAEGEARRALLRSGLLAAAVIALLFAPWLPTLVFQAGHTGAPWANSPPFGELTSLTDDLLGHTAQYLVLLGAAGGALGLMRGAVRRWPPEGRAVLALVLGGVVTFVVPWVLSQSEPAWAGRYLAIGVGPLVLLGALGLSRSGAIGIAAVALVALLCYGIQGPSSKSNVGPVARAIAPSLAPGDLVISTQPEQAPVLHYYLARKVDGPLRWATLTGPLTDLGVTDWRDGTERLEATSVERDLAPLLDSVKPGQRVLLVAPDFSILSRWKAPWTELVRLRSVAWEDAMRNDRRFRVVAVEPPNPSPRPNEVRATLFVRQPLASPTSIRPAAPAPKPPADPPS
jgi:hypothetical protein